MSHGTLLTPDARDSDEIKRAGPDILAADPGCGTKLNSHEMAMVLHDGISFMRLGVQAVISDEFTECFTRKTREPTSTRKIFSGPLYCVGWVLRYFLLFPYRLLHILLATMIFLATVPFVMRFKGQPWKSRVFTLYCKMFLYSWGSCIRYHGKKPRLDVPHIFVCNHTSFIDYIVVSANSFVHSTVAQKHGGIIGWFENCILTLVGSLTFDRTSKDERKEVVVGILEHISDPMCAPLLIFPEGTCVNNEFTVLFHKGAFEIDCYVVPIAIKYDKSWADAYWHTKTQSFTKHLFYLMTRWALIADVWFLPPRKKRADQTAEEFAAETKAEISKVAKLKNISWDGYFKNIIFLKNKQAVLRASPQSTYFNTLLSRMNKKRNLPKALPDGAKEKSVSQSLSASEEPTRFRNTFLVEVSDTCNISIISSYFDHQADILNKFNSYGKGSQSSTDTKTRTENIVWRTWSKNKNTGNSQKIAVSDHLRKRRISSGPREV